MKSTKNNSPRTKAIAHYHSAHEQFYGVESTTDLSGISNEEIWKMGDELQELANQQAVDAYEAWEGPEELEVNSAFASLGDLIN